MFLSVGLYNILDRLYAVFFYIIAYRLTVKYNVGLLTYTGLYPINLIVHRGRQKYFSDNSTDPITDRSRPIL